MILNYIKNNLFYVDKGYLWAQIIHLAAVGGIPELVENLIDNRDKIFDKVSMQAFESLKAYKYFHDGLVRNIWAHKKLDASEIILQARFLIFESQINLHCVCLDQLGDQSLI